MPCALSHVREYNIGELSYTALYVFSQIDVGTVTRRLKAAIVHC
jgi:hypothetical protein